MGKVNMESSTLQFFWRQGGPGVLEPGREAGTAPLPYQAGPFPQQLPVEMQPAGLPLQPVHPWRLLLPELLTTPALSTLPCPTVSLPALLSAMHTEHRHQLMVGWIPTIPDKFCVSHDAVTLIGRALSLHSDLEPHMICLKSMPTIIYDKVPM